MKQCPVELETNLREGWGFAMTDRVATKAFSWLKVPKWCHECESGCNHFHQGGGSSRGLLCDCETSIFAKDRFKLYWRHAAG